VVGGIPALPAVLGAIHPTGGHRTVTFWSSVGCGRIVWIIIPPPPGVQFSRVLPEGAHQLEYRSDDAGVEQGPDGFFPAVMRDAMCGG
jgi:hypothetical protein